jgi:hypothetical protein
MIGCATLTLLKYTGTRSGRVRFDDLATDFELAQTRNNLPWHFQCECARKRFDLLQTTGLGVASRLHVVLPCLAFGTPVMIPSRVRTYASTMLRFNR